MATNHGVKALFGTVGLRLPKNLVVKTEIKKKNNNNNNKQTKIPAKNIYVICYVFVQKSDNI